MRERRVQHRRRDPGDRKGDIVTNAHVTGHAERFLVTLAGGDRRQATLVGADPGHDLAVVHLRGDSPTLAALDPEFGDTQAPGIGFAIPSDTVQQVADRLIGGGL